MLDNRFQALVGNWRRVIGREFIYGLFQRPYFQTVLRIPMFLALPAFLAGKVTLGGLMQVASAFQNTVTTLSWFVFNYKFVSELVATTRRLQRFLDAIDSVDQLRMRTAAARDRRTATCGCGMCRSSRRISGYCCEFPI